MSSPQVPGEHRHVARITRRHGVRVGHLFLDIDTRQLMWLNEAARELHQEGVPMVATDLVNHPLHHLDGEQASVRDLPLVRACKERTPQQASFLLPADDGSYLQVAWTVTPTHDTTGHMTGLLASVTVSSPEPNWEILAGLTHDLRTPLQAVQLYAELLDNGEMPLTEARELAAGLRSAAERAMGVSRDLFEWCRTPASNGRRLERVLLPLAEFLDTLVIEHKVAAQKKGLELVNRYTEEIEGWQIASDPIRMGRLLSNLLANAIRYTRVGRVEILARWRASAGPSERPAHFGSSESSITRRPSLVLSVVDTGVGISREEQESIFQPFAYGREALQHDSTASGLGLAVVERLTEELGLILEAYSEPGRGSAFDLVIPGRLLTSERMAAALTS